MHKLIIFMTAERAEQKGKPEYAECLDCGEQMLCDSLRIRCGDCQIKYWDNYIASTKQSRKVCEERNIPFNMGGTFDG